MLIGCRKGLRILLSIISVCIGNCRLIVRVLICAVMVAVKYVEDFYYKN